MADAPSKFLVPQAKPARGPWYEGWYVRVTDPVNKLSFATISTGDTHEKTPLERDSVTPGYVALVWKYDEEPTHSVEEFPKETYSDSFPGYEPAFEWVAKGLGKITDKSVDFAFSSGQRAQIFLGQRKPWSEGWRNWGPGGPLTFLPMMPMLWYVDSLGTPVTYSLEAGGRVVQGTGFAHVEKNWGKIFPRAWMWVQATSANNEAHVALAGGPLGIKPLEIVAYFVGYKAKGVDIEIRPDQLSRYKHEINAKAGTYRLVASNWRDKIVVEASAPPNTFAPVSIPTPRGYEPHGGLESFGARVKVSAYRLGKLVGTSEFENAALEFGADYMRGY